MFPELIADNFDLSKILWRKFQLMHLKYSNALNGIIVILFRWLWNHESILSGKLYFFLLQVGFFLFFLALWPFYTPRCDMFY